VLDDYSVLNETAWRYEDDSEAQILDAIGDLYLLGTA